MPKLGLELTAATADRGAAPPAGIRPSHELQCQDPKGGSQCRAGAYVELRGPEDSSKELAVYTCFFVFFFFVIYVRVYRTSPYKGGDSSHTYTYMQAHMYVSMYTHAHSYTPCYFSSDVCMYVYVFGAFFGWSLATDA